MTRAILLIQQYLTTPPQLRLARKVRAEIKTHQVVDTASWIGGVFPKWVWLSLDTFRCGRVFPNLQQVRVQAGQDTGRSGYKQVNFLSTSVETDSRQTADRQTAGLGEQADRQKDTDSRRAGRQTDRLLQLHQML